MLNRKIIAAFLILAGFALTGFQCGSPELTSGRLYIQQKNWDKAIEVLEQEVQKNPQSDEGYYLLGVVYGEKEQYTKMIESFDKSVAISNKFASNIEDQRRYFWANLFNKGVNLYNKAVNAQEEDSAKVYFDKSLQTFDYAVALQPDSPDTYKNLAFVYINLGEEDKAIGPLQKLIDLQQALDGYKFLGDIYYKKGSDAMARYAESGNESDSLDAIENYNTTIKVLEEGRKYHPSDSDILLTLSNAYIGANKVDVALDAFKTGVEAEPDNKYYRYNYGVLLLGNNEYEKAVEQFEAAVNIDPVYENAIYNLGVTYVKWGTAINKSAEDKGQMDNKEYLEKYRLALPHMEKIVDLRPEDIQVWELLGRVYTVLGMQEEATDAFTKADELRNK